MELDVCGSPCTPLVLTEEDKSTHVVLHHLTVKQFSGHLTQLFSGVIGTDHNTWLQAPGCPCLGSLLQVEGEKEPGNEATQPDPATSGKTVR